VGAPPLPLAVTPRQTRHGTRHVTRRGGRPQENCWSSSSETAWAGAACRCSGPARHHVGAPDAACARGGCPKLQRRVGRGRGRRCGRVRVDRHRCKRRCPRAVATGPFDRRVGALTPGSPAPPRPCRGVQHGSLAASRTTVVGGQLPRKTTLIGSGPDVV